MKKSNVKGWKARLTKFEWLETRAGKEWKESIYNLVYRIYNLTMLLFHVEVAMLKAQERERKSAVNSKEKRTGGGHMTANALNVAWWFVQNNNDTRRNSLDGNMKLQKLLYFSQLVHLAKFGEPLFKEDVIAFKKGSVIEEVRQPHRHQHRKFIDNALQTDPELTEEQAETVGIVNSILGELPARELSDLNHLHKSWIDSFQATVTNNNKSAGIITVEQMKNNEVPGILEMLEAYDTTGQKHNECIEINGRKFYFDPTSITFDKEVMSMVESFNGPDSAYTIYRDPSVGVVIY